jgi:methyltransferase (TIGR00027 family)
MRILTPRAQAALQADPRRFERRLFASGLRAHLAVRSRVAEDALASAVNAGVRQYVVLGAGLDTFALRNTEPSLRIFEVDHPSTQAWKRQRLKEASITEPPNLTFAPVDFERQRLETELEGAGFAPGQSAFFSWLGVAPYLEEHTIWSTLRWVVTAVGDHGGVVFDYAAPPPRWNLALRALCAMLAARVAAVGEPFRSYLQPDVVVRTLRTLGYASVEDLDCTEINRRYFAARTDGLKLRGLAHIVIARGAAT